MPELKVKRFFNYSATDGSYIDFEDVCVDRLTLELEGREIYPNPALSTDISPLEPKDGFKVCFSTSTNSWRYCPLEVEKSDINSQGVVLLTDAESNILRQANDLQSYLNSTDWYVTRFVENSIPIPDDVKMKRQEARTLLSNMKPELDVIRAKFID